MSSIMNHSPEDAGLEFKVDPDDHHLHTLARRSIEYTVSFTVMGTPAGRRRFWRMFSGEPKYRYPGGPPLIHKGRKGRKP